MSFAMLETARRLTKICKDADGKDIVMLCSDHDQGSNVKEAWPAAYKQTLTIAACNEYGMIARQHEKATHEYALAGLDIAAGSVPFLESFDRISGSSVATAIAAGLSSLILSCNRLARNMKREEAQSRCSTVTKHLDNMKAADNTNYVLPEKFGNIDQRFRLGENVDASNVIRRLLAVRTDRSQALVIQIFLTY